MTDRPIDKVLAALGERVVRQRRNHWDCICPNHDDQKASLSVSEASDGTVLLKCHAGCKTPDILKHGPLTLKDLFPSHNGPPRSKLGRIVATYDYKDETGTLLYQVVRFDPKDFRQRKPDGNGGWLWSTKGVHRVLYRLPELLAADKSETVLIVEGEKDTDRLRSMGLVATTCAMGASQGKTKWLKQFNEALAGRNIVILPDNDDPGRHHADMVARSVRKTAASVKIINLPVDKKQDVSDWLDTGGTKELLATLIEQAPTYEPTTAPSDSDRTVIVASTDEHRVVEESISALRKADNIYQRGGTLVHVVRNAPPPQNIVRPSDAPSIAPIDTAGLRELITTVASFYRIKEKDELEPIHPPVWCMKAIEARGQWDGIRRIEAVTETPLLRSDGTILDTPGFDESTGILYAPKCDYPPIPNHPTKLEAERARDALLEVVEDFPFAYDVHRSAWLASVLTPFARYTYHGCTPMFLAEANTRGTGKGLLVDTVAIIATGQGFCRMTLPKNDEEMRKRITAIALAGEPLVLLDNIAGKLDLPSLDAALTSTDWADRILGASQMTGRIPLNAIWFATGNNLVLGGDTPRRVAHMRLESTLERPETREDFHHPRLLVWIRNERPRLVAAALTILRAYFVAGKPLAEISQWGSFNEWSDAVRQAVVWLGLSDPAEGHSQLEEEANDMTRILAGLLTGWQEIDPDGNGITASNALKILNDHPNDFETLRSTLMETKGATADKLPSARSVGMTLHHLRRKWMNGRCLDHKTETKGTQQWVVRRSDCPSSPTDEGRTKRTNRTKPLRGKNVTSYEYIHRQEKISGPESSPISPSSPSLFGDDRDYDSYYDVPF